jgi:hypothetical protein
MLALSQTDPQRRWHGALIKRMTDGGMGVAVGPPRSTRRTMVDRNGEHEVRMTEPDEEGLQYNVE